MLAAGMESRLHSAVRMSFPTRRAQLAVLKMFCVSLYMEYPQVILRRLLDKHGRRYPLVYGREMANIIHDAIAQRDYGQVLSKIQELSNV